MMTVREILEYIEAGKKIQVIKLVRNDRGCSLIEAKQYVDELEQLIKGKPTTSMKMHYDSEIMAIDGMEGHRFEYFCADVLRKIGFLDVKVTPGSGDQGVDILASKDDIKYAIQCKNYTSALGNTPVQEVAAGKSFYGCHVGVVLTNSTFTTGAVQLAAANNVLLWDRYKLEELIAKAGGLEEFQMYPEISNFCSIDNQINDIATIDSDCIMELDDGQNEKNDRMSTNARPLRKGMYAGAIICFVWSGLCSLILLFSCLTQDKQMMTVGLGEGMFFLIFGIMFGTLARTEKKKTTVEVCNLSISKTAFVLLCIVLAYALFIASMYITGWQ